MFDQLDPALHPLREFMAFHAEPLQNASLLLGRQPALRRTQSLLDDIRYSPRLTRRMSRELVALQQLLALVQVHETDRFEAACYADIDPSSPIVEDICLLREALKDEIYRLQDNETISALERRLVA